jgi:hypothetical protein
MGRQNGVRMMRTSVREGEKAQQDKDRDKDRDNEEHNVT